MPLRALFDRRESTPQTIDIVFNGCVHRIRLCRHRLARRYTLRIHAPTREVILTLPPRGTIKEARSFAEKHGGWIATRLRRLPVMVPFADGTVIPVRGMPHRIAHRRATRGTVWIEINPDGERLLCVAGQTQHIERRIGDFLRREARRDLESASRRYAQALGLAVRRVTVRDQSSRWGSCSTTGRLSYSWRLILAPPHVLEYLAAHEVAHLVEMNHSSRFWRLVRRICPEFERAKGWLDAHGGDLHRYGNTADAPPCDISGMRDSANCSRKPRAAYAEQMTACRSDSHLIVIRIASADNELICSLMKAGRASPHPPTPRRPVR